MKYCSLCFSVSVLTNKEKGYQNMVTLYFFLGGGRGGVCSNIFCETGLFRNILKHLSTKLVGKELFFNTSFR